MADADPNLRDAHTEMPSLEGRKAVITGGTTGIGRATAVLLASEDWAARRGLPVALHTPSEVKAAVTGNGRAPKDQVKQMVVRILGLTELPEPADAADALALAICHLWRPPALAAPGAPGAGPAARSSATAAQRAWAEAEAAARRGRR